MKTGGGLAGFVNWRCPGWETVTPPSLGFAIGGLGLTEHTIPDWNGPNITDRYRPDGYRANSGEVLKGLTYPPRNQEF